MCDYSLHAVASRPAKVGETLVTTSFYGTSTRGFAAKEEPRVAVCLLPGTELAFEQDVRYNRFWLSTKNAGFRVAGSFSASFNASAAAAEPFAVGAAPRPWTRARIAADSRSAASKAPFTRSL